MSDTSSAHVSAIICTRNRPDLIGAAVASVLANTYLRFDVLVVDQSDDDRTAAVVRQLMQRHANLRYLHTPKPGLSRAYNIGIRETTGEILAFTDDDCIAPANWIETIVEAFASDPQADMVYGQVLRPADLELENRDVLPTLAISAPRRLSQRDGFQVSGMGANFGARRQLFEKIGLFDEMLGGGAPLRSSQDFDFQYRAYVGGAVVLLRPEIVIDHYGVRDRTQWPATMKAYGIGDGAFYLKHIRCGDLFALSLFLRRVGRMGISWLLHSIRHKPSHRLYVTACLEGALLSSRYPVDRARRLYRAA